MSAAIYGGGRSGQGNSVNALDDSAGVVVRDDAAVIFPCACSSDHPALAHTDPVTISGASGNGPDNHAAVIMCQIKSES